MRWARNLSSLRSLVRYGICAGGGFVVAQSYTFAWQGTAFAAVPVSQGGISGKWKGFRLVQKLPVTHSTTKFVFAFQDPEEEYGLSACTTLEVRIRCNDGTFLTRHYTPVSQNGTKGRFEIIVKLYPGGLGSTRMFGLKEGDVVEMRAKPLGMQYVPNKWEHLGMIAGGAGLTPMLQLIREALSNPEDTTKLHLLLCTERCCDIILRSELDRLSSTSQGRLSVNYCLAVPPLGWRDEAGWVTPAMVRRTMPPPSAKNFICVCGPPGMMETVAGCNPAWIGTTFGGSREGRKVNPAVFPEANNMLEMRHGILHNLGYKNSEVFRF